MDRSGRRHWRRRRLQGPLLPGAHTLDPPVHARWPWLLGGLVVGAAAVDRALVGDPVAPANDWPQLFAIAIRAMAVLDVVVVVALVVRWRGREHARVRAAGTGLLVGPLLALGCPRCGSRPAS
ncbi:hypothetical protein [Oryzihumus leptocrescens]|uniref:Uncharacterized protein n=1 Tax=Oryzihumus leptocrescens TaxID=297536 RepID=A0A542ZI90_9MICO|nr:hypothetical protein [Oryzihumus leptocrescens]TQL60061.1 hypothetical protein FB474_1437 [Oryzihumus leptocrescens]